MTRKTVTHNGEKYFYYYCPAGKKNGCLIEGMACPGGCIGGAGTNIAINQAVREVAGFKNAAAKKIPDKE